MQQISTLSTNSTTIVSMAATENAVIPLPSALTNSILSFNYTLNGNPVLDGMTGVLTLTAQYKNGKPQSLGPIDLETTYSVKISGKYTQLNVTLDSLSNADTLIIYVDQIKNN